MLAYWHVTNRCAFNCHYCYVQANRAEYMEVPELVLSRLINDDSISSVVLTGGEPLLCKDLVNYVNSLREAGKDCRLYTSGWSLEPPMAINLVECGISRIRISCDSPRQAVMGRYTSFDKICSIGRQVIRSGAEFEIGTTIIPGENDTSHEIEEMARVCIEEGFLFSCSPMFPGISDERLKPIPEKSFALLWKLKYSVDYSKSNKEGTACDEPCPALNSLCAILPDGKISPCDNLAGAITSEKSIVDYGIADIIASESLFDKIKQFIPRHNPPCSKCNHLEICCGGCRAIAHFNGNVLGCDPWGKQKAAYYLANSGINPGEGEISSWLS